MNRKEVQRKRTKAIKMLRDTGMTDAEIEAELGFSVTDGQNDCASTVEDNAIIDAEIVSVDELSKSEAMEMPVAHLPVVLTAQPTDSNSTTGRDWSKSSVPERRCRAHRKTGEQCKNAAILGSTVCRYHGGASKHVKMAARARLENATDLMAKQLLGMAIDPNVADAVKLSAIKDALDRGGLKALNEVVVSAGAQAGFDEIFDNIATGVTRAESRRQRGLDTGDSIPNDVGYQDNCSPAPGDTQPYADADSDYDPPAATEPDSDRPPVRDYSGGHITGAEAIRVANQVNLRALPPGRGD